MNPDLWAGGVAVFEKASTLEGDARTRYLDEACGTDGELRDLVERLLAADAPTRDLLARGMEDWAGLLGDEPGPAPEALGPWRVVRELGRGGMGTVYLGERADGRFQRTVALKVVRAGFASRRVLERFEAEARILASLEHPGIARLYDVGMHEGRPYLVLEYVEGERVDRSCDAGRWGIRRRLELFRGICAAVQFAHQNLVIHRDLKPSNILVTPDGAVRLLDFGIARLLPTGDEADAPATRIPLTPEYASPEQLRGRELTTSSDVYSLGVLLHELLTGRRPFEAPPGDLAALVARVAAEPPTPSAVVTRPHRRYKAGGSAETVPPSALAAARGTTPERLRRALRGDLDRIVLKALRPDPGERYPSAEALSEDLRRFLSDLPVSVRRDSRAYRASRFVRRHRAGVAAAAAVVVALASATGVAVRQARVAERERDAATRAFGFLEDLLTAPDPHRGQGVAADSVRMVDFLDDAAERIDTELTDEPVARARMLTVLGRVYLNLGRGEQAIRVLDEAVTASRAAFGPSTELAQALGQAGFARDQFGDRTAGEALIREALETMLSVRGERTLETARWQEFLGRSLLDSRRLDEAEPYLQASWETRRALLAPGDPELARSLTMLSALHSYRGETGRAVEAMEEALGVYRQAGLEGNPDYAIVQANLAQLYQEVGRMEDADLAATEALDRMEATMGRGHFLTAATRARLAGIRGLRDRPREADSLFREAVEDLEASAPDNLNLPVILGDYAAFLRRQGRLVEAEVIARRCMEAARRNAGDRHPLYAGALLRLGDVLRDEGEPAEAAGLQGRARTLLEEMLGPEHPQTQAAAVSLARSWTDLGRTEAAEELLVETFDAAARARGRDDRAATRAADALVDLYRATGREAEAARFLPAHEAGGG